MLCLSYISKCCCRFILLLCALTLLLQHPILCCPLIVFVAEHMTSQPASSKVSLFVGGERRNNEYDWMDVLLLWYFFWFSGSWACTMRWLNSQDFHTIKLHHALCQFITINFHIRTSKRITTTHASESQITTKIKQTMARQSGKIQFCCWDPSWWGVVNACVDPTLPYLNRESGRRGSSWWLSATRNSSSSELVHFLRRLCVEGYLLKLHSIEVPTEKILMIALTREANTPSMCRPLTHVTSFVQTTMNRKAKTSK